MFTLSPKFQKVLIFIGVIICVPVVVHGYVISTDTIVKTDEKTTNLKELVVEGAYRKDIKDGVAFFPTKRDKKFATDAVSLLQAMALTELPYSIEKHTIVDVAGTPVIFFIDGKRATSKELKGLNPTDVDRVEYLPMPIGANFGGEKNIVNIVMKKYVSGGFTKFNAHQYLDGESGNYDISSKLAYKEMTYSLYLDGSYRNDNHNGIISDNIFRDIEYNGINYDLVSEKIDNSDRISRNRKLSAMLAANWKRKNVTLTVTGGWNWQRIPCAGGNATTVYSPSIINSSSYHSNNSSLGINPYIKLNFNLELPKSQSLSIYSSGDYAYHNSSSDYAPVNLASIFNGNKDKRWSAFLMASYSKSFDNNNSFGVTFISRETRIKHHMMDPIPVSVNSEIPITVCRLNILILSNGELSCLWH